MFLRNLQNTKPKVYRFGFIDNKETIEKKTIERERKKDIRDNRQQINNIDGQYRWTIQMNNR